MKQGLVLLLAAVFLLGGCNGLKTQKVEYKDGDTTLEGYLVYDGSIQGTRPGVLVVHEWDGLGKYARSRANQLAKMGYVAFAPDIYGKGIRPAGFEACMVESNKYKNDRALMRRRAQAGLEVLKGNALVDPKRLAAIGYCFGGTVALELARDGAPLAGVVSFHGGLDTPRPKDARKIKGKVLVLQGGADDYTLKQVPMIDKEMKDAKVDYKMAIFAGAKHGFTNPENKDPKAGVFYDAGADRESWREMQKFFEKIFK
jgi:dienelactone hydrolase